MEDIKLSIIIPVFNGSSFLEEKLKTVSKWAEGKMGSIEIIFINDGSTDATPSILNRFRQSMCYVRVFSLLKNRGKGFALCEGIKLAQGEYIGFTDADLPYGFIVFEHIFELMERKRKVDLVFGSRSHQRSKEKNGYGFLRKCGRLFFSVVIRLLVVPDVKDTQCGVKMFRREFAMMVLRVATVERFAFDIELFAIALQNHRLYEGVPVELTHRKESSVHFIKDTLSMLCDILKIRIRMWQNYYVWNKRV